MRGESIQKPGLSRGPGWLNGVVILAAGMMALLAADVGRALEFEVRTLAELTALFGVERSRPRPPAGRNIHSLQREGHGTTGRI